MEGGDIVEVPIMDSKNERLVSDYNRQECRCVSNFALLR